MSYPTIDTFAYAPVIAGMWQQHELWDGTYIFSDWLDAVEMIEVKNENDDRYRKSLEERRGN